MCDAIATHSRQDPAGHVEQRCAAHSAGDGWARTCSIVGCQKPPRFKVEYRVGERLARLTACPEHFQIMPEDISEVFKID